MAVALKPGGIGVLSTMGNMRRPVTHFLITKHIFPGGCIPGVAETLELLEEYGLHVVDIESLRHHYYLALEDWYAHFMKNWHKIQQIDPQRFNESFRRKWTFYLLVSAESFRNEREGLDVFHIVFTKGRSTNYYPTNRGFLYDEKRHAVDSARKKSYK